MPMPRDYRRNGVLDLPDATLPSLDFQSRIGQFGNWEDDLWSNFTDTQSIMDNAMSRPGNGMFSRGWNNFKGLFNNSNVNNPDLSPEQLNANASAQLQKWQSIGIGLQGVAGIGNLYLGNQALRETKRQNAFERDAFERNYAASKQQYNTQLEARKRRALNRGGDYSDSALNEYMKQHKL